MLDLLSIVVFLPTVGCLFLMLLPAVEHKHLKAVALAVTVGTFACSIPLWLWFDPQAPGFQYELNLPWIAAFGIRYHVGVDGISLFLILLTTFLMPITVLSAWNAVQERVREFVIALCFLETGMLGAFVSLDLFLFYVFWEVMLIPMYFLIGIWGGKKRLYAAFKFFLFTLAGSLLMLIAIIYVARQPNGVWSFDLNDALLRDFSASEQLTLFLAFALAFAIKVPMFPVHTWLPDAHTEAPTAGSVILAGVLLKLGVYGFLRFAFPIFPSAAMVLAPAIAWLAVIGIVYGALAAWVQPDMKKLVAYSSVSHLGFCMLGLGAMTIEAVAGSVYQLLAHGISTGGLFLLVGVLYERRHTRLLSDYGGIARKVPVFAFFLVIVSLASAGLPTLSNFPGEFMILLGTFTGAAPLDAKIAVPFIGAVPSHQVLAVLAATGVILAAVYLLWMVQKVLFGPLTEPENERLEDMSFREVVVILPIVLVAIVMGLGPTIFMKNIEPAVQRLVSQVYHRSGESYRADPGVRRMSPIVRPIIREPTLKRLRPADLGLEAPHSDRGVIRPQRIDPPPAPSEDAPL